VYKPNSCGIKIVIINLVKGKNGDFGRYFNHYAMEKGSFNNFILVTRELFLIFSATMYHTF